MDILSIATYVASQASYAVLSFYKERKGMYETVKKRFHGIDGTITPVNVN